MFSICLHSFNLKFHLEAGLCFPKACFPCWCWKLTSADQNQGGWELQHSHNINSSNFKSRPTPHLEHLLSAFPPALPHKTPSTAGQGHTSMLRKIKHSKKHTALCHSSVPQLFIRSAPTQTPLTWTSSSLLAGITPVELLALQSLQCLVPGLVSSHLERTTASAEKLREKQILPSLL